MAQTVLDGHISDIDDMSLSFKLNEDITDEIRKGEYSLDKKRIEKMQVRASAPIGKYILENIPSVESVEKIVFDLESYPYKSVLLEEQKGNNGWLVAYELMASNEYDNEESIIFCVVTNDGHVLPSEFGVKLLELDAETYEDCEEPQSVKEKVATILDVEIEKYKDKVNARMEEFANYEIEKYESWSDDQLVPLQNLVVEVRKQKDAVHRQIRKERSIKEKLLLKKQESLLADKLARIQRKLFDMEDEYNKNVDKMTTKLLNSLESKFKQKILFSIKWEID